MLLLKTRLPLLCEISEMKNESQCWGFTTLNLSQGCFHLRCKADRWPQAKQSKILAFQNFGVRGLRSYGVTEGKGTMIWSHWSRVGRSFVVRSKHSMDLDSSKVTYNVADVMGHCILWYYWVINHNVNFFHHPVWIWPKESHTAAGWSIWITKICAKFGENFVHIYEDSILLFRLINRNSFIWKLKNF